MTGLELLLLAALAGACIVAILRWDEIQQWLYQRKTISHNIGIMIKEELANGRVGVCTGVFDKNGDVKDVTAWKCETLDYGVADKFGNKKLVRMSL